MRLLTVATLPLAVLAGLTATVTFDNSTLVVTAVTTTISSGQCVVSATVPPLPTVSTTVPIGTTQVTLPAGVTYQITDTITNDVGLSNGTTLGISC